MASSSHSTPYASPLRAPLSIEPYRDPAGFLPLVQCHKCGTKLIGHVSQKSSSKGKRFYKCPQLEHTDFTCGTYMFEEEYVEYLVKGGYLPAGCSRLRGPAAMTLEMMQAGNDTVRAGDTVRASDMVKVCNGVEACHDLLQNAVVHLNDANTKLKLILDAETKVEKIGERLLAVAVAKLFVLVLVLLVLLVLLVK